MWFKLLLSKIFKRDFTVKHATPEEQKLVDQAIANGTVPQYWSTDCNPSEIAILSVLGGNHLCCDGGRSYVSCGVDRHWICQGHGGVCCSRC